MFKKLMILIIGMSLIYLYFKDEIYTNRTITFGSSLPQSGIMQAWGKAVYAGANSYFSYANEQKLLKDRKIKLISYDDKYEPELTLENLNTLVNDDKVFALFGFVGTPTVKNILPIIDESQIPFISAFTGASFLRAKERKNIINFRSSYQEEINTVVTYLYKTKRVYNFAIFYQNDDYGEEGYVSLLKSLKRKKLNLVGEGTYKRNTLAIRHALLEIKESKPQAVIMVGAYKANALFIKKAKKFKEFKNTIFCNISFGDANEMIKELNFKTKNVLFSQVVPSYTNNNLVVVREYAKLMKKYYPKQALGFISLESFLSAKSLVNALKNIKGAITRSSFLNKLKTLDKNQLGNLETQYKNTQLLNKTYIFEYKENKFKEVFNAN